MEHEWKWIAGGMIFLLFAMRFAKGSWPKAIMAAFVAPLLLVPMFYTILIALTSCLGLIGEFFVSGDAAKQVINDFCFAGSIAISAGLLVFYCLWERQTIGIEPRGTIGGSSNNGNFTSPHALKRKMV